MRARKDANYNIRILGIQNQNANTKIGKFIIKTIERIYYINKNYCMVSL